MKRIRCEITTVHDDHAILIWNLRAVPRLGDHLRVDGAHSPGDDDLDRAERVTSVLWQPDGVVVIDTTCEPWA